MYNKKIKIDRKNSLYLYYENVFYSEEEGGNGCCLECEVSQKFGRCWKILSFSLLSQEGKVAVGRLLTSGYFPSPDG